jgi:hypothetical protein
VTGILLPGRATGAKCVIYPEGREAVCKRLPFEEHLAIAVVELECGCRYTFCRDALTYMMKLNRKDGGIICMSGHRLQAVAAIDYLAPETRVDR